MSKRIISNLLSHTLTVNFVFHLHVTSGGEFTYFETLHVECRKVHRSMVLFRQLPCTKVFDSFLFGDLNVS